MTFQVYPHDRSMGTVGGRNFATNRMCSDMKKRYGLIVRLPPAPAPHSSMLRAHGKLREKVSPDYAATLKSGGRGWGGRAANAEAV